MMKTLRQLPGLLFVLVSLQLSAQVDSIDIDGKYYKVYPIREKITIPTDYWKAVKDEAYFSDPENYFNIFGESRFFTREDFEEAGPLERLELQKDLEIKWKSYRKWEFRYGHGFKRAVRKNPTAVIAPNYDLDQDIIPSFGAIPDGDYVQLFSNFCLIDKKGNCQEQTNRVAAYFSIKNNVPHGYAVWIDLRGDTIKQGSFDNGVRTGTWKFKDLESLGTYIPRWSVRELKRDGELSNDTSYTELNYSAGVLHGDYSYYNPQSSYSTKGQYVNGEKSGNWRSYYDEVLLMNVTYAEPDNPVRSHKPIIRTGTQMKESSYQFNTEGYKYSRYHIPENFYEIDFGVDEMLDLEEEAFQSHELEYESYGRYTYVPTPERILRRMKLDQRSYYTGSFGLFKFILDPNTDESETRNFFIDSIGAKMLYDGPYEIYYPNGQLFTRYVFENGELKEEGTLYWDNGQPYDVIEFNADSNQYYRRNYDYDGQLMYTAIYDSIGDFLEYEGEIVELDTIQIDGIVAEMDEADYPYYYEKVTALFPGNYVYRNFDVFDTLIPEDRISLYREYNGYDKKTLLSEVSFDPKTRTYVDYEKSYTGHEYMRIERVFSEDYSSWNGTYTWKYGRFTMVRTSSAIFNDFFTKDTVPIRHVRQPYDLFDVTSDVEIFRDGELYTGKVRFKTNKGSFKFRGNKLVIQEGYRDHSNRNSKHLAAYLKKGKHAKDDALQVIRKPEQCDDIQGLISRNLFQTPNSHFFWYNRSNSNYNAQARSIKGQMLEGKPQGHWTGHRKRKLTNDIHFDRGEPFGTYMQYGFEPRASKRKREYSVDTLPKKKVYYLNSTQEYVNGQKNGPFMDYNWHGGVQQKGQYTDDMKQGEFIHNYPLAYSVSQYKDGYLDGYVQTYLTIPHMDTMLLYDINFQDGALNGESNAYHTNGKLAKRGFFLDDEPIDDYEAYDTLGFRYHYVKFQYGFPVEEKIWEENQLSLRYVFNWEDSIDFDPSDITSSMSLESLLSSLGYGRTDYSQAYYGRKRLINKAGLTYHMTKFYPNDTIARIGNIDDGKKIGHWKFYDYDGNLLYEVDYFDSIISLNDSVRFKSKGIYTDVTPDGVPLSKAYIIEKMEKYDCAHTDHYEIRQFYTFWEADDTVGRMNGYVQNFYDNGVLQSEGVMKDGLPTGLWKYYDPFGKLNLMGSFHEGKRHGRWLSGDLEKKKYLGEICLNPNLPDLEAEQKYRENLLDVTIITYYLGQTKSKQFFDLNLNKYSDLIEE